MVSVEKLSIVCNGKWNRRIFTPAWVSLKLFDKQQMQAVVSPDLEVTYQLGDISLTVRDTSIEITIMPQSADIPSNLEEANKVLEKILHLLPETPYGGIGFNVRFLVKSNFEGNFFKSIKTNFSSLNSDFTPSSFRYTKKLENNASLNCIVELNSESNHLVTFNLHHTIVREGIFKQTYTDHYNNVKEIING